MATPFTIQRSTQEDLTVLSLAGYLDAHTAPEFENTVQQEIDARHLKLIVNCEGLSYISSAGLGVFMSFLEELREQGGDIKICGPSPKVLQVFELLGFPAIFDMLPDVPAAVKRYAECPVKGGE
ncbi:Anti-sigma factor antagonist [Candidatus Sulfopaludibacter sp. SbA3]|nr:Anti-sigma factor antagonist [Candidatus Sulfopaludibacter sp. SbA3]